MTESDDDLLAMRRALAEAEHGRGHVEPNPVVGAVLVRDGEIVGVGHHARFGGPHAEIAAIAAAGPRAQGATLYVTLEPCCHQGKTPPCTEAVVGAGIARVVAALRDPFPRVDGGGFARLRECGVTVESGLLEVEARAQNAPYLKRTLTGRPFVIAKWAMTLDGKLACATGDSQWISGPRSRAVVHALRGRMDGIVVGIGTVLADDPQLTARPAGPRTGARIVLDGHARLPLESRIVQTARATPVIDFVLEQHADPAHCGALREAGCEVVTLPGREKVPIGPLLDELGRRGMTNLLVEGGGMVLGALQDAGEIDAYEVFIAPKIEGGGHDHVPVRGRGASRMAEALRLERLEIAHLDGDVHVRGLTPRSWLRPDGSVGAAR